MKAPVNATLLIGFIAALASSFEARADLVLDEVGVTVRAWHRSGTALNNATQGAYALWDVGQWRDVRFSASVMALRLSNDRDGVGAGVVAEYGHVFAGLHLMHGYQDVTYSGNVSGDLVCRNICAWRTAKDRLTLVPSIGVRLDAGDWRVRLSYQPSPRNRQDKFWHSWPGAQVSDSVLLTVGKRW